MTREEVIQLLNDYIDYIASPNECELLREIKQTILTRWKE
jgi:hypothetical protein